MEPTSQTSVEMRDDTALATDVYRPETDGETPAVLLRTPYGDGGEEALAAQFAQDGFAVVVQQVRGSENHRRRGRL